MISSECPECGEAVPLVARACGRCGAANPARRGAVAVAAALVVLIVAAAGAISVATRPHHPAAPEAAPASPPTAAAGGDFAWLASALTACDDVASQQPGKLHFLVIPLIADRKDMPDWRLITLGAIGNAITVAGSDALGGLRRGTLRIDPDEYVFSVQDTATNVVYKWSPAAGAKRFSTAEAVTIPSFRLQIAPRHDADPADWGDVFSAQNGKCHWVAAIVRD